MLGDRDLVHLERRTNCIGRSAADELDDGGGTGQRETTEASCLGYGAVADVRVGVVRSETGEVETARHVGRASEPAIPEAGDPNTELRPVP